jgi:predicted transcriptional regulator
MTFNKCQVDRAVWLCVCWELFTDSERQAEQTFWELLIKKPECDVAMRLLRDRNGIRAREWPMYQAHAQKTGVFAL